MPLLIICGPPCSGKTTIADRFASFLASKGFIRHERIGDESDSAYTTSIYDDSYKERGHRDILRSNVQRLLSKENLVICDSTNYIKGFRYELYCIAKLVQTTFAVIHCNASLESCRWYNYQREEDSSKYDERVLENLFSRFETPESRNRWDSPLFTLHVGIRQNFCTVDEMPLSDDISYPGPRHVNIEFEELYSCLIQGKMLKANRSTLSSPIIPSSFLQEVECVTQDIVRHIVQQQKSAKYGSFIPIPLFGSNTEEKILFKQQKSIAEYSQLRRQFISYIKMHPVEGKTLIASLFVNFLNSNP